MFLSADLLESPSQSTEAERPYLDLNIIGVAFPELNLYDNPTRHELIAQTGLTSEEYRDHFDILRARAAFCGTELELLNSYSLKNNKQLRQGLGDIGNNIIELFQNKNLLVALGLSSINDKSRRLVLPYVQGLPATIYNCFEYQYSKALLPEGTAQFDYGMANEFLPRLTQNEIPILFFIPEGLMNTDLSHNTKAEMLWFLANPEAAGNLFLIFGHFSYFNIKLLSSIDEELRRFDRGITIDMFFENLGNDFATRLRIPSDLETDIAQLLEDKQFFWLKSVAWIGDKDLRPEGAVALHYKAAALFLISRKLAESNKETCLIDLIRLVDEIETLALYDQAYKESFIWALLINRIIGPNTSRTLERLRSIIESKRYSIDTTSQSQSP